MNKAINCMFIILAFVMCISCGSYNTATMYADADTISIDGATRCDSLLFSDFFKAPKVVLLETKPVCVVQNIRSLEIYKEDIYILDDRANKLYVFDGNGKFKRTISSPGRGHGEYMKLADFSIDRTKEIIYLLDEATDEILKFRLDDYKFLSSIKAVQNGYLTYCMQEIGGKIYLNRSSVLEKEKYELREIDERNGKQVGKFLKSDDYNHGWNFPLSLEHSNFYSKNSQSPKYIGLFSNLIMNVTADGVSAAYIVDSRKFVNKDEVLMMQRIAEGKLEKIDFSGIYSQKRIHQISRFIESPSKVFFQYLEGDERNYLVYDKASGKTKTSSLFMNDYVSDKNMIPMDFCYSDERGVVALLKPCFMPHFIKYIIDGGKMRTHLDNYSRLIKLNKDSNPVLFFHEYK
ncbi:6-bladed beta-propeller [Segatella copri]|uniref:6-bladed beta-propeller n=1 Tax=Segatella copri TaxID=165179 RepID=UPI001290D5F2|nr:6-bladed beta-propeller [Segatella copri]MQM89276.1 6-bladed beta-propeller [Segatella copri]MQM96477.1 6-bladed beta-propeller [Segatella copri]MQN04414.1 6-bladed beta-propeller [Segatella copri]MQN15268.1 6-bladed beta-propeller [Segatella copri]MQN19861.1 6-bladed beta-propeller [Segatella copri]